MNKSSTLTTREHPTQEKFSAEVTSHFLMQSLDEQNLAERVESALRARGYLALYAVRVSVRSRVVFLEGRVSSFYLKQLAQATVLTVPGAHQIRNNLNVVQPK